ncbi:Cold shock protein CspA [Vibrio owensii]|uniref:cold shock domain-containing protein n=1 Tax=Vibrio owensii TaxID=696485 RepID=UPI002893D811|nr:Cold shock protein CspA [Vibrio owensii]CAH1584512.1 Cold shock protein CspA [Vibrio owensii]
MTVYRGVINAYVEHKGIGFIRREKGKDVFFSIDDLDSATIKNLHEKLTVEFEVQTTPKGPKANKLRVLA